MELCSVSCGSLDGRGFGEEWVHVYDVHVWLSPFCFAVRLSTHGLRICYTLIQGPPGLLT